MSKLTEKAVALLQEGEVNLVIGYEEGNHGTRPLFCRQAENADRLILDLSLIHISEPTRP